MNEDTQTKTHCQICARPIKANTGRIAHHGYQRPGTGWQTASCDGAKQLPYEVSRDFIPVVIERYKVHAKIQEDLADEMLTDPSETITRLHQNPFSRKIETYEFAKPEGFSSYEVVNKSHKQFPYASYENEFIKQYQAHRQNVRDIQEAIGFLQRRYDDWKVAA
ncbi:hypothetical protein [Streptomyces sp. BBFR109]|uniref:hypothetical protein n=1 Tax=Streptomyces sp. BBFR109 TaxID=3448172 RepID=UPI003F771EC9